MRITEYKNVTALFACWLHGRASVQSLVGT